MKKTSCLLAVLLCCTLHSVAQKESRIVAQSSYIHDASQFNISDTTFYHYTTLDRGGDLKSRYISFDDATTYTYDNASSTLMKYKKIIQRFDAINHRSVAIAAYWNKSIGAWEDATTDYYYTTINDSLTGKVEQTWNKTSALWNNTAQQSYTYDAANNRTSYTLEFWNTTTSSWIGAEKYLYEYDATNNLIKKTFQIWDAATSAWEPSFIDSFTYSSTNKVLTLTNILWNKTAGIWKNNKQISYTYNTSTDFLINQVEAGWDAGLGAWYNVQQQILINDSKGNVLDRTFQNWNTSTMAWDNFRKQLTTYDSKNNITNYINQRWEIATTSFANSDQRGYTYDASNNRLTDVSSLWNASTNMWDSSIRISNEYNAHNQKTMQNYENWDITGGFWKHNLGDQLFHYYYEEFSSALSENVKPKGTLLVYPIPAQNELNINLNWESNQKFSARITDLQGRIYRQWDVPTTSNYTHNISLSGMGAGNYIIEFASSKEGRVQQMFTKIN